MSRDLALFDLLWASHERQAEVAAGLTEDEWHRLDTVAAQHRLRPLLRDRTAHLDTARIPCPIRERWHRAHRRAAIRALRQRTELRRIARLFDAAGIHAAALKGAGIVWQGWIDPALRPMRDLDILVADSQALEAHALLRRHGFSGDAAGILPPDKHLPGLTAPETRILVELHTRLAMPRGRGWEQAEERFRSMALEHQMPIAPADGGMMAFDATDTLLHTIVHSALDHQFNNGPLMLTDIALLVAHGAIDWRRFWAEADLLGVLRACQLSLRIAERHACQQGIDWGGRRAGALSDDIVDAAAAMMLVDMGRRSELGWAGRLAESGVAGPSHFWTMLKRRWRRIGAAAPAIGTSGELRHAGTMMMIASRYMSSLSQRDARRHIHRTLKVARWLRG